MMLAAISGYFAERLAAVRTPRMTGDITALIGEILMGS